MNAATRKHMARPYQADGKHEIYGAWNAGHRNVLYVLPTGGGKTFSFASIVHEWTGGACCAIAHRQELVGQISLAFAREGVYHKIIAPRKVIEGIVQQHMEELGASFYDPRANCAVAGVDTLVSWSKPGKRERHALLQWAQSVTLWVQDEAHHLLKDNKWGEAVALFPNAWGLGVTATPERADGKGLGRGTWTEKGGWTNDGLFDFMVLGPTMRELINGLPDAHGVITRYLTDYRVFCPPSNLDLSSVTTGKDGDYIRGQLALKTKESTVLGDVVEHYLRLARGKRGVTFVPDTETAAEMSARFNAAGVPAEVVTAKTPGKIRRAILKRFAKGELLQLVNVDLFGEGFDLPAIEVVSMARATQSYALFVQQFGRALRLMLGKEWAIIIDHVGNIGTVDNPRHGLPDRPRVWSLERRDKRTKAAPDDKEPTRNCVSGVHFQTGAEMVGCFQPYEAYLTECPYCGCKRVPADRTKVEFVDGDLFELDQATLAAMRGEVAEVDTHTDDILNRYAHLGYIIAKGHANRHGERQTAQTLLREAMGWWGAWQTSLGRSEAEAHRRFFYKFKIDVLSAQSLKRTADAEELAARVTTDVMQLDATYRQEVA